MKTLVLVRGLPGAGKTSFIQEFLWDILSGGVELHAYAADDWQVDEHGDYDWKAERVEKCHQECQAAVEWDMAYGCNHIVVHNTLTKESEIEPYTTLAKKYGYRVVSLIVENRHGNTNVHDVPESTITKMRNRFSVKL